MPALSRVALPRFQIPRRLATSAPNANWPTGPEAAPRYTQRDANHVDEARREMTSRELNAQMVSALRRSVLFVGLPPEALEDVSSRFHPVPVYAGTVCCREGQPGHEMYVVQSGRFAVDGHLGEQPVRFAELGPSDLFGEMAVLTGQPRSATVTAETDGCILALRQDDFQQLAQRYPSLSMAVGNLIAERTTGAGKSHLRNEKTEIFSLRDVKDTVVIGRADTCDIVLEHPTVSRTHAIIRCHDDACQISDLNSSNGTFVNGVRIDNSVLRDGDTIWIGGVQIYFDRSSLTRFSRGGGVKVEASDLTKVVGKGITILSGVSLAISAGELVCIVGGSGAGKTTLLDTLNGFRPSTSGRVMYNDIDCYQHFDLFRQGLGYVPQDDIVHPELTVHQTLYFAARLRLPGDTGSNEIETLINEVLESLELTQRRDVVVQRLSGGQRKRVSIGVELLTKPDIFFLDEPTSGLDPGLDGRMMELLRKLADEGRTVILTTHATRNIMMADKVVFMARGGHLAYFGTPAEALSYFGVDDFTEIYKLLDPEGSPQSWDQHFRQSEVYDRNIRQRLETSAQTNIAEASSSSAGVTPRRGANWFQQVIWLTMRYLRILIRDPISLGVLMAASPLIASVMTQTFGPDTFALTFEAGGSATEAVALLFFMATSSLFLGGFVASRSIAEERAVYMRERLVNLGLIPYVLSKVCVLGLFSVIQSVSMTAIVSWGVTFPDGRETLVTICGILILTNLVAVGMGLLISALASNGLQATLILVVLLIPQLLLGGAVVPLSRIEEPAKSMSNGMINRWAVSLLGHVTDVNERLNAQLPKNDFTAQFDIQPERYWLILGGLFVSFVIGSMLVLKSKDVR
ncbi:MAG: ATP-binding cassette domain-containing protein [Chloroflexota bacterium]